MCVNIKVQSLFVSFPYLLNHYYFNLFLEIIMYVGRWEWERENFPSWWIIISRRTFYIPFDYWDEYLTLLTFNIMMDSLQLFPCNSYWCDIICYFPHPQPLFLSVTLCTTDLYYVFLFLFLQHHCVPWKNILKLCYSLNPFFVVVVMLSRLHKQLKWTKCWKKVENCVFWAG